MARGMVSLGLVLAVEVCAVSQAAAHGRPPEVTQITMGSSNDAVVATTRGLLFGDPGARRWSLLCSEAFGVTTGLPYRIAQLPNGQLYVASVGGMRVSDDQGCSWRPHPSLGELDVTYLFQEAARPERIYVTVFGGGEGGIRASDDGGDTFRVLYRASASEFLNSLEVAAGNSNQIYATLSTTEELPRLFVLRSSDGGATWSRTELRDAEDVIDVGVLAINPADAGELLLRVRYADAWDGDGLLWSRDGGQSFTQLGHFGRVADATFTSDGLTSYLVASGGLLRSSTPDRSFTPAATAEGLSYGAVIGQRLLVSGYRVTEGRLDVNVWSTGAETTGGTLDRWMSFEEVTSPKSCPASSTANARCALDWIDWSQEFLPKPPVP